MIGVLFVVLKLQNLIRIEISEFERTKRLKSFLFAQILGPKSLLARPKIMKISIEWTAPQQNDIKLYKQNSHIIYQACFQRKS